MDIDLSDVLLKAISSSSDNIFTAIPAVVLSVKDLGQCRVDVQPTVSLRDEDGVIEEGLPAILNVPVHMPTGIKGGLTFPVSAGEHVLLVFSQRGIDNWKRGSGGSKAPSTLRKFDMQDAIAITGVSPFLEAVNNPSKHSLTHSPSDLVLAFNLGGGSECEVRMKPDGNIIVNSPNKVEVNCETALVNSKDFTVNTNSYTVNSSSVKFSSSSFQVDSGSTSFSGGSYTIGTGTYSMSATDSATSTGVMSHNGRFTLDGTDLNAHTHGGVQSGGSNTAPFGG